ncbi:MAG: PAS domain S-box protein, partial [Actinomycetota bacterium]|nr:PAS domain S-box protein [Actinomycetota bacterium]
DLSHVLEETEKALSEGGVATNEAEYRFRHADGSWRWMQSVGTYLPDDPAVRGIVVNSRDVTERKQAEETLKENEIFVRWLLHNLPNGSENVFDRDLRYLLSEGRALEEIGLSSEMLVGRTLGEVFGEERLGLVEGHYRKAFSGEEVRFDLPVDGRVYEINVAPLHTEEDGEVRTIIAVAQDITERKRAEERLREMEQRSSTLLSNTPALVYRCLNEPDWPEVFVSDYALELTGYPPEDLLTGGTVRYGDLIVEEDRLRVWEEVQEALAGRWRFRLRYSIRRKDGEVRHVEEYGQGIYGKDGSTEAIEGLVYDVTEVVRSEERLREAEEKYRTLIEQMPAVTYIDRADDSDTPLYTSPQIEEMLGYTPEEWQTQKLWPKRLHPDDRERVLAADERFEKEREERFVEEYRLLAKDGSVVWVREEAMLVTDGKGDPLFWQGVIYDLTERKGAEEQLRLRDRAIAASSDGIIITDPESSDAPIVYANPAFERITGYGAEEVLGRNCRFLQGSDRDQPVLQGLRTAMREGREFRGILRNYRKDGTLFFNELHIAPVREEDGRLVNFVGVQTDVTPRIRAEQALRKAEERYRTLVEKVSAIIYIQTPREGESAAYDTTYISPTVEEVLGYPPQSFTGAPGFWDRLIHPEDLGAVREEDERTDETGEPFSMEYRVIANDGRTVWIRDEATLVRDDGGEPLYWLGVQTDVTERRLREAMLRETEARYRSLVERVPAAIYRQEIEHNGAVSYISPQIEALTGYAPGEYADPTFWVRTMHPDDRARVLAEDERTDRTGEPFKVEFRKFA